MSRAARTGTRDASAIIAGNHLSLLDSVVVIPHLRQPPTRVIVGIATLLPREYRGVYAAEALGGGAEV